MSDLDLSEILDVPGLVCEFLEASINNILFLKRIYPDGIFNAVQKFGTLIHVSAYPPLNDYIAKCLQLIKNAIDTNDLKSVEINFCDQNSKLVERVVFHFEKIILYPQNQSDPYLVHLHELFRTTCLKMSLNNIKPLPIDSTFRISVNTSESFSVSRSGQQEFPWIEEEFKMNNSAITPIKTLEHNLINMSIYIEDN